MEQMIAAYRRYADFEGRSRRSEFWLFHLFQILAFIVLAVLGVIFGALIGGDSDLGVAINGMFGLLILLLLLGSIIPNLAVAVRRLHDSDKSGWFLLLAFVPLGGFVLLVFYCLDGTPGTNRYGPDPKARGGARTADIFS